MRRDIGNEVIVAIAAVAVLAFALAFAILLSLSSSNVQDEATATGTVDVALDLSEVSTELMPTDVPTDTSAFTPTATDVSLPTETDTPIPTETDAPALKETDTPVPAVTDVSAPKDTDTPVPTETDTPAPMETETLVPTATDVPLPTETDTSVPTEMDTAMPTATDTPVPTYTSTEIVTSPITPQPVGTLGILPTPVGALTATPTPIERGECVRPYGWSIYTVQSGNTLFLISMAVNSTVVELAEANCIDNVNQIQTGDELYVPRLPAGSVSVGSSRSSGLTAEGCGSPNVQITNPTAGQIIRGVFTLTGTATHDNFWYYRIEVRPDQTEIYNFYSRSFTLVEDNALGAIDSDVFEGGLHWLRLSVIDNSGGIEPTSICTIPVFFD